MSGRPPRDLTSRVQYPPTDQERWHVERLRDDDERSPFEIDRSRIIHSVAFRRLQGKTQIFGVVHDDFFRTRLTHSLEVAQIAKGIALICKANPELVEAISLAHDIGHPPFGHTGERALNACLEDYCGLQFESNAQNIRTLAYLEAKHLGYPGLNLTRATLDGLMKHKQDGGTRATPVFYTSEAGLMAWVSQGAPPDELSLEALIVDWADQVAYSVHDLEDGIHAGMITSARMSDQSIAKQIIEVVARTYPHAPTDQIYQWLRSKVRDMEELSDAHQRAAARKQLTSELIHSFVTAAKPRRRRRDEAAAPVSDRYGMTLFLAEKQKGRAGVLNQIARQLIIHDQRVATLEHRSAFVVRQIFSVLVQPDGINLFPEELRQAFAATTTAAERGRCAADFIAGMTDNYAEMFFQRLFSPGASASNTFDRF